MLGLPSQGVKTVQEYQEEGVCGDDLVIASLTWTSLNAPSIIQVDTKSQVNPDLIKWLTHVTPASLIFLRGSLFQHVLPTGSII